MAEEWEALLKYGDDSKETHCVLQPLGHGGFGSVFRSSSGRLVLKVPAVRDRQGRFWFPSSDRKKLPDESDTLERVRLSPEMIASESDFLSKTCHENIIKIEGLVQVQMWQELQGSPVYQCQGILMECGMISLAVLLRHLRTKQLEESHFVVVAEAVMGRYPNEFSCSEDPLLIRENSGDTGIFGALSHLHDARIAHNDVTLRNIVVMGFVGELATSRPILKLIDFGNATLFQEDPKGVPPAEYRRPKMDGVGACADDDLHALGRCIIECIGPGGFRSAQWVLEGSREIDMFKHHSSTLSTKDNDFCRQLRNREQVRACPHLWPYLAGFLAAKPRKASARFQWKNKRLVMAELRHDGCCLCFADETIKKDMECVLAAVEQNGLALRYAHPDCQRDKACVLAAVTQTGCALKFAHPDLQKDKEVVLAAIRGGPSRLPSSEMLRDAAALPEGCALKFAHPDLQKDKACVLASRGIHYYDSSMESIFEKDYLQWSGAKLAEVRGKQPSGCLHFYVTTKDKMKQEYQAAPTVEDIEKQLAPWLKEMENDDDLMLIYYRKTKPRTLAFDSRNLVNLLRFAKTLNVKGRVVKLKLEKV